MSQIPTHQNFIDGAFVDSPDHLEVFNPANGDLLSRIPESDGEQVERAIGAARDAQKAWAALPAIERPATCAESPSVSARTCRGSRA